MNARADASYREPRFDDPMPRGSVHARIHAATMVDCQRMFLASRHTAAQRALASLTDDKVCAEIARMQWQQMHGDRSDATCARLNVLFAEMHRRTN